MALATLERRLGYDFGDPQLLHRAMCHRSWVGETEGEESNERLEFLGDAVLGWVVADLVYHHFADLAEGDLTNLRKSVVSADALADLARQLDLGEHILLGRGEAAANGHQKVSILSDALEAVVAAVYLDGGFDAAFDVIERHVLPRLEVARGSLDRLDQKSALHEFAATNGLPAPEFDLRSTGPDHAKVFYAEVSVGAVIGVGEGRSKKAAEQEAAAAALNTLLGQAAS